MGDRVTVTIDGFPCLGSSTIRWALREGTSPYYATLDLDPESANSLLRNAGGRPVKLEIRVGSRSVTVDNVWVLHLLPGDSPYVKRALIADRRWFWKYGHIVRRYNIRRRIGYRQIDPDNPDRLQANVVTADRIWYARYSLKDPDAGAEGKWRARDVIEDVLRAACAVEKTAMSPPSEPSIRWTPGIEKSMREIPIENLILDDRADQAVSRALSYLPEAGLFVDLNGNFVIYSRASGGEKEELDKLGHNVGAEIVGMGRVEKISGQFIRPREIHVGFHREIEVRFDFSESASASATVSELGDTRRCENVIPVPDFNMTIETADGKRKIPRGTWVALDRALMSDEWQSPPGIAAARLDHNFIQRALVPFMDLWSGILLRTSVEPDSDWAARIAAIQAHYRRTFRINPRWMDRIYSVRAYRISTLDVASGQRSPAVAFADHAIMGSQRSQQKERLNRAAVSYAINVDGYPPDGKIGPQTRAVPGFVTVLDSDQGIVHVDYRVDPNRVYEQILPSKIVLTSMPNGDLVSDKTNIAFNAVLEDRNPPRLSPSHKIAFIVTCTPACPNTEAQLHWIVVKPEDVADLIPGGANGLGASVGPVMKIAVGNGIETARIAWSDEKARDIEKCFGFPQPTEEEMQDPEIGVKITESVRDITVNHGEVTDPRHGASLTAIAKAIAARVYASMVDHFSGEKAAYLAPNCTLDGWATEISHQVGTRGETITRIVLPEQLPKFDPLSWMDAATRATILRQAQG